jgi:hypothetical protein
MASAARPAFTHRDGGTPPARQDAGILPAVPASAFAASLNHEVEHGPADGRLGVAFLLSSSGAQATDGESVVDKRHARTLLFGQVGVGQRGAILVDGRGWIIRGFERQAQVEMRGRLIRSQPDGFARVRQRLDRIRRLTFQQERGQIAVRQPTVRIARQCRAIQRLFVVYA